MALLKQNLAIDQGATFRAYFVYSTTSPGVTPVDITSYTARMQLRKDPNAVAVLLSLTDILSASGQIILGGALGTVQIYMTDTATMGLAGGGAYDLEIVSPGGDVTRLLQGNFAVNPNVTR